MHVCNVHPHGIVVLGELHLPTELGFEYPLPAKEYDAHGIAFMQSQIDQGKAATGIVKCFRAYAQQFMLDHRGRIVILLRNPMEVIGSKRSAKRFIWYDAETDDQRFENCVHHYKKRYEAIFAVRDRLPIIRIEDLNRSCGGDCTFAQAVFEYITQVPFPIKYMLHVKEWYLPGYHYPSKSVKNAEGVVIGIYSIPYPYQLWRMTWADDPLPAEYWKSWPEKWRGIYQRELGEVSEQLGYNCSDNPGFVETVWSLRDQYSWKDRSDSLKPIPYRKGIELRHSKPHGRRGLPVWREDS